MKNKTQNLVIVFLTIVVILLFALTANAQVMIGWGPQKVFMLKGGPDYMEEYGDTTLQIISNGWTHLYFKDRQVVRQIELVPWITARREQRYMRKNWYDAGDGWYYFGGSKCRITFTYDNERCLECRKPEVSVANMRKTKKK